MNEQSADSPARRWRRQVPAAAIAVVLLAAGGWVLATLPGEGPLRGLPSYRIGADMAWLVVAAGVAIGVAAVVQALRPGRLRGAEAAAVGVIVLATLAALTWHALETKSAVMGGRRVFWLDDDMMISMRYARHIAAGHGAVWNIGGPRVEGYTNWLWMLAMVPPHWLLAPEQVAAAMIALNALLLVGVLAAVWRLAGLMGLPAWGRVMATAMVAGNRWVFYWTEGGAEVTPLAFLLLGAAVAYLRADRRRPLGWGTGCLLGLAALTRADAPVPVGVMVLVWWWLAGAGRARRWAWLPAVLMPAALMLWRRLYYGDWVPNTYYLRMVDVASRTQAGGFYLTSFLLIAGGLVLLCLLHGVGGRRGTARGLAAVPLVMLAYGAYAGGDELSEFRFYAPVAPLLIVVATAGAWHALRRLMPRPEARPAVLLVMMLLAGGRTLLTPHELNEMGRLRALDERDNVLIGLMLRENTAPDALIAHAWAGAAPYFSERPAVDMLGKMEPRIARRASAPDDPQTAHNKYDPEYIFGERRPDVVVSALSGRVVSDRDYFDSVRAGHAYPGLFRTLDHPVFWSDYAPNVVPLELSMRFHGVFVREGTALARPPQDWREPAGP